MNELNANVLHGEEAFEYARRTGAPLNKYEDPTEGARIGIDLELAEQIACEDVSLLWVEVAE